MFDLETKNKILSIYNPNNMLELLQTPYAQSQKDYVPGKEIYVFNKMEKDAYTYKLTAAYGEVYEKDFNPYFSPPEMLSLGVFEGKYLNDCVLEFPREWFLDPLKNQKLSPGYSNIGCNYFNIKSRLSLEEWKKSGWIGFSDQDRDNRGWFQWYCRYYIGRRIDDVDYIQKKRWRAFVRHFAQVKKNCTLISQRPRQRQALLQWSYNCFVVCAN